MTSLRLYDAVSRNILAPWNKNEPEEWKGEVEVVETNRGSFAFEPGTGIHENEAELDFYIYQA